MSSVSKTLILIGVAFIIAGLLWHFSKGQIPFGKLPGDIHIKKENSQVFIPITSSIIISLILSLIFYFFRR